MWGHVMDADIMLGTSIELIDKEDCKGRNGRYDNREKYIRHWEGDAKLYECKDCGNIYATYLQLWRHLKDR